MTKLITRTERARRKTMTYAGGLCHYQPDRIAAALGAAEERGGFLQNLQHATFAGAGRRPKATALVCRAWVDPQNLERRLDGKSAVDSGAAQ
jgi:hypothetical protein